MESILTPLPEMPPTTFRTPKHRPVVLVASLAVHLALVGALWSAQVNTRAEFLLAGSRGSIELQATVAQPAPTETPIVERRLPTEIRIEPDHAHVDHQTIVMPPPIALQPIVAETPEAIEHPHIHPHEHSHEHLIPIPQPVAKPAEATPPTTHASTATKASTAVSTGNEEQLPTLFHNPPPPYPAEAFRARIEGTTLLRIGVRSDGIVEFVEVAQSSGNAALDEAATSAVKKWRFTPGRVRGSAAPFVLRLPIVFKL